MKKYVFLFFSAALIITNSCKNSEAITNRTANEPMDVTTLDYNTYVDSLQADGIFLLYDLKSNKLVEYKGLSKDTMLIPASTFKIPNSLIGLETGKVKDELTEFKWNGTTYQNQAWNRDQNLRDAFQNSTVWYFQELARKIGEKHMKKFLAQFNYGNQNTGGGIDQFWLSGELRISPLQQLEFLKGLWNEELKVSKKTTKTMKKVFVAEKKGESTLYAKTGWGFTDGSDIGWYMGVVENEKSTYLFVHALVSKDSRLELFGEARKSIARRILNENGILTY
ncbi:MAG: penicillin-binding transpeptidase domain-containing protein [Bacteroidota bacterium]